MLLIAGVLVLLTATVIVPKVWLLGGRKSAELGCMGQEWLAQHRAAQR